MNEIGPLELFVILVIVAVVLLVVFLVIRIVQAGARKGNQRECPACGTRIERGPTICPACGHDFAASAR